MKIGLIGCGRVGLTLCYIIKAKNEIVGIYDVNKKNEEKALRVLGFKNNPPFSQLIAKSEVLFFATPDDEVLNAFNRAKEYIKTSKYCFHFSGLLPAEIFPGNKNIFRGSLHPLATIPRLVIPPPKEKYFLFFQGDRKAYQVVKRIFPASNFVIRRIERKYKKYYHLVGVFASNLLVGLARATLKLAKRINWQEREFKEFIIPLMADTIKNIKKFGIKEALSGPLVRGDTETIRMHLEILKKDKELAKVYELLSRMLLLCLPLEKQRKIKRYLKTD